ncbi:Ig-like domain-containing protein [Sphingobacterium multivorum]|uniref:Ig-like domain-containing protein n=1 Tax=Sphingobacterium multivorum TaxID=28454 RepID=UPI0028A84669|nr:Ig-like domain-containing protein [Sphingobacterium multivorum]
MNIISLKTKSNWHSLSLHLFVLHILILAAACGRDDISPARLSSIKLEQELVSLGVGKSIKLSVKYTPVEIKDLDYIWSTSDPQIATVADGIVYGHQAGETKVTVSVKGQTLKASTLVRVLPILPATLKLSADKTTLLVGEEVQINHTIAPEDVSDTNPVIEWNSSDTGILTVDNGKVKAVGSGTAQVSAVIRGTAIKGEITIQIQPVPVASIELNKTQAEMQAGTELLLTARVLPVNADQQNLLWSSSDEAVATVTHGKVKGLKPGQALIKVTAPNNEKSSVCTVIVKPVQEQRIELSLKSLVLLTGGNHQLEATVFPDATSNKNIQWTSSNNSIATVSAQGLVTGRGRGTAIINAVSVANPQVYASCNLSVLNDEDQVYTQITSAGRVSDNGYVTADFNTLFENGSRESVRLVSWEVLSYTGELITGDYLSRIIATSIQQRHRGQVRKVYRPYVRYIFELKGQRYERRMDI